ncbi:hypothetical protein [Rossellomorea aquimaris]|uniref:hypothetical protein n=1 Tax=Rossellomorea aquimaris TaxID=189382 RepID=UPI000A642115|nr:hypothetical protein [Rossellomorea aquimaris]
MELIMIMFVFLVTMGISSVLNILFLMTEKKHWIMSLLISSGLSLIIVAMLAG